MLRDKLANPKLREQIRQSMLNFASDYHNYQDIREDIMIKGVDSHPYHINQILDRIKSELDKLTEIDNPYPVTTRFRDERYIDEPLHIGFGVGSKEQLHHTKKQLLDLIGKSPSGVEE
uniref:Uncharacterized protein n=1 Tax=viral metagenome TaxID=1070528 RepID=A0A6M3JE18_9ZZZZ